tara:strand:- start:319 stop:513 length:195 start_codon:yes stop_codon:yes gene_type:complete
MTYTEHGRANEIAEMKAMIEMFEEERAEARACGYEFPTFSEYCQTSGERYDAALFRAAMDSENS